MEVDVEKGGGGDVCSWEIVNLRSENKMFRYWEYIRCPKKICSTCLIILTFWIMSHLKCQI